MLSTLSALLPQLLLLGSFSRNFYAAAHTVISYPGWRGNNLHINGTEADGAVPQGSMGINWDEEKEQYTYPYGMQWMYPCGGLPTSQNRTKWPVNGGALAVQPGWNSGHATAFFYVNLGIGTEPLNMSHPMVPVFQITGPTKEEYPGTFCLPQVPLPANLTFDVGQNATIQVVETAVHGAALYSCVDITFAEAEDVERVTKDNCFNSTGPDADIGFNIVFTSKSLDNAASPSLFASSSVVLTYVPYVAILLVTLLWI